MLLSTIFFTLSDVLGKYLTGIYPIAQVTWLRCIFGLLFITVYMLATGQQEQLQTGQPKWHLLRGILAIFLLLSIFYSLDNIPLAEFIAIMFSSPFFIALLSPWLLHERVSRQSWIAIMTGFIGILIVTRPTPDHFHIAHITALVCALCTACLTVTARRLSTTESAIALNFYMYPLSIVILAMWAVQTWIKPSLVDWFMFAGIGFTATAALWCVIRAMSNARPAVIAPIDYVRMVWTIMVAWLIWQELPDALTWTGILIIAVCGLFIVTYGKRRQGT